MIQFFGIDPGLSGQICRVSVHQNGIWCGFIPLEYNKSRTRMITDLSRVFDGAKWVVIEQLAYIGVAKGRSLFTMAQCFGALTQCVEQSYDGEIRYVRPCDWKRAAGLINKTKKESVNIFYSIFPKFSRNVTHDQAESFLLSVGYLDGECKSDILTRCLT